MREQAIAEAFRSAVAWYDPRLAAWEGSSAESWPKGLRDGDLIRELARIHGMRVRRVRLRRDNWWRSAVAPIVAFSGEDRQPVALIPTRRDRFDVADPTTIHSEAFQLYPRLPSGVLSFAQLLRAGFARRKREAAALLVPIGLSALVSAAFPWVAHSASGPLRMFALLIVLSVYLEVARGIGALRLQGKLKVVLVPGIWDRLLRTELSFFRTNRPSEVVVTAGSVEDVCDIVTSDAAAFAAAALGAGGTALVMAWMAPRTALLICGVVLIALAARVVLQAAQASATESLQRAERQNSFFLRSLIWDLPHLRLIHADAMARSKYMQAMLETIRQSASIRRLDICRTTLAAATPAVALLALVRSGHSGDAPLLIGTAQLIAAAALLEEKGNGVWKFRQIVRRLQPLLGAATEPETPAKRGRQLRGAIRLDRATFHWPGTETAALDNVSIEIAAGEFVGLAGPSGSGKSTLIRLLLGLDRVASGEIEYDGEPAESLDTETLRSQIEAVLQDQVLTDGTIRANILGPSSRGLDDAWEAARIACVADEITAMPMGMQTFAGESVLSAAQRQRILLARAIVRRPAILLLDESLSGLDEQLQHRIIANLRGIAGMTCIVASHRPSMATIMDRTYRLERGRIQAVEQGNPLSLEEQGRSDPDTFPSDVAIPRLFRPEAVERFESAEPLDRLVQLS